MAKITRSALLPLLDLSFSDLRVAMMTGGGENNTVPTVEIAGNVSWYSVNTGFELCLSKNTTGIRVWEWAIVLTWSNLSFLTDGLEEYLGLPDIDAGATLMISPTPGYPSVRPGYLAPRNSSNGIAAALGRVVRSSPLKHSVLQILPANRQGRRLLMGGSSELQSLSTAASSAFAMANMTQEFEYAQELAERKILHVRQFVSRLSDGVGGTISFRNRSMSCFVKAHEKQGVTLGAVMNMSTNPLNVGQVVGGVMDAVLSAFNGPNNTKSSLPAVINTALHQLKAITISSISLAVRTEPLTVTLKGSVKWGSVETDLEFSLTKNVTGNNTNITGGYWEWALAIQWSNVAEIAALICPAGSPVTDYLRNATIDPLEIVITSTYPSYPTVGWVEKPAERRRRALLAGQVTPLNAARERVELYAIETVKEFVQKRLNKGLAGNISFAGVRIEYLLVATASGFHIASKSTFDPKERPSLTAAMGPADFSRSKLPTQVHAGFFAFLKSQVKVKSMSFEAWTDPPHISMLGEVEIGSSILRFSFLAKQPVSHPPADWHFDLAVQTDILSALWNSIPRERLQALGLSNFHPNQTGLEKAAIHVQHQTGAGGYTTFEAGTVSAQNSFALEKIDVDRVSERVMNSLMAGFEASITIPDVPIAG